jgi:DNA-binding transcriptional ArsR family regulator
MTHALTQALTALADPTRRSVLQRLAHGPATVGQLAALFPVSRAAVSQHLRVLREAGLVRVRRDGKRRWYGLRAEPLAELDTWLAPYRELWAGRLDALEQHLDQEEHR